MRLAAAFLLAVMTLAIATPGARADGDSASDYLLGQNMFLPFDAKIPAAKSKQLAELLANADRAGFRIRVAIISTRYDLGSVTVLYRKPQKYAEFLGAEIFFAYRGRLLVVMPNGYGYSIGGKRAPGAALNGLSPAGRNPARLVSGAVTAVQRLATANGVRLGLPRPSSGGSTTRDRIIIVALALTSFALVGSWILVRRLRASRET